MKVYLINLDANKDRLLAADSQLSRMGVMYRRISAIYGKALPNDEKETAVNHFRLWFSLGRQLRDGELGCAMSHYSVYHKLIEENCPCACILEDDVLLDEEFPHAINEVEAWLHPSIPQVVLLSNHSVDKGRGIVRSQGDMYTEGYILTRSAAEALLKANWPLCAPCDHWRRWVIRGDIELYHYFPTVCRQDQSQYQSNTGGGFVVAKLPLFLWILHKMKRSVGKPLDALMLHLEGLMRRLK